MIKHTPTPWIIFRRPDTNYISIDSGDGRVCRIYMHYANQEANAEHIVKCVNVHEELVEALKGLLKASDQMNEHIDVTVYNKAQEALKKSGTL